MFSVTDQSTGSDKYAGRSVGKVLDNVDPKKKGRIRVYHPFLGDSVWIEYLRLPGQFTVPEIDELVYVEADAGWIEHPIAWGNLTQKDDAQLPEVFKRHKPTNRGLFTPGGHLLEMDDGTGVTGLEQKGIRVTTSGGKKFHILEDLIAQENKFLLEDENGNKIEIDTLLTKVTVSTTNGAIFEIDGVADAIKIASNFGDTAEISALNGIQLSTPAAGGTSISMNSGSLDLASAQGTMSLGVGGDINLANAAGSLVINAAGQVELAGATDGVVALLQEFAQELSTDTFAGFGAPAGKAAIYAALALRAQAILAV